MQVLYLDPSAVHTTTTTTTAPVVAAPVLTVAQLNGATAPATNPCASNVTDSLLTKAMVQAQFPGFKWGNSEPWTAEEMQCWGWLATLSGEAHPDRAFSKQYGFEPYLIQL